jgi:hypothetical protein
MTKNERQAVLCAVVAVVAAVTMCVLCMAG